MLQRKRPSGSGTHNWGYHSAPINKCRILLYVDLTILLWRNTDIHCSKFAIPTITYVKVGRDVVACIG
jgi:hypothetical protein